VDFGDYPGCIGMLSGFMLVVITLIDHSYFHVRKGTIISIYLQKIDPKNWKTNAV